MTVGAGTRRGRAGGILLAAAAILAAVALVYSPTPAAPFFFDDTSSILLNPTIKVLWPPQVFLLGTRPLLNLSYAVTFQLSGESPAGHRLFNIGMHALNAFLVYVWVRRVLRRAHVPYDAFARYAMALIAGLLYAVHPLQTEAVTYVSGRADVLACTFVLVAAIAVSRALDRNDRGRPAAGTRAGAVAAAALAMLCKESAVVTPLLLFAYECLVGRRTPWAVLHAHPLMYGAVTLTWVAPAIFFFSHPEYAYTAGFAFGADEYGIRPWHYLLTQVGVVTHYLRLVVFPWGQVFDYDWPLATSIVSADVWLPAVVLVALGGAAWLMRERAPLYTYAVLWVVVALAPTSSLVPIADVIAERRMYMAMVGACLLVVLLAADVVRAIPARRLARAGVVGMVTAALTGCAWLTWQRNHLWRDPVALWRDTLSKAPGNPRAHLNLGTRYLQRGDLEKARVELETAIELIERGESRHAIPRHAAFAATYLGLIYLQLGQVDAALAAYDAAIQVGAQEVNELRRPLQRLEATLAAVRGAGGLPAQP